MRCRLQSVRRNLLTSDWWDEDHQQSLLNRSNSKWASEMMANVRLACCVAGVMRLTVKEDDLWETLELLATR